MKMWIFAQVCCHAMFCFMITYLLGYANLVKSNSGPSRAANPTRTSVHIRGPWANKRGWPVQWPSWNVATFPVHTRFRYGISMVRDCAIKILMKGKVFRDSGLLNKNPVNLSTVAWQLKLKLLLAMCSLSISNTQPCMFLFKCAGWTWTGRRWCWAWILA